MRHRISRKLSSLTDTNLSPMPFFNSKITAFVQKGQYLEALKFYSKNLNFPLNITQFTFPSILKACASLANLHYGKTLHSTVITMGLQSDPFITTSLINMYSKCGSLTNAVQVFDKLSQSAALIQDKSTWNSIIDGHFRYGRIPEGIGQFCRMLLMGIRPDGYSLCILLGVCRIHGVLGITEGKQIHGYIIRNLFDGDPYLETALMDMYFCCNRPMDAGRVFDKLEDKHNVVAWNVMIGGFCESGLWEYSLGLYALAKNDAVKFVSGAFSCTMNACSQGEDACFGIQVHCDVLKMGFENDPYVNTSLLTMYAKCELVQEAVKVFHQIPDKETELWNAMIAAYVGNACAYDALEVYNQMKLCDTPPDCFTLSNILQSSCMIGSYNFGRSVHAELVKRNVQGNTAVSGALLSMYYKCGSPDDAYMVFSSMKERDVIAWGCMISGFCQSWKFGEALHCFKEMEADGVKPDSDIMASVISACAGLENVDLGSEIHGFVIKSGLEIDVFVATSLVDMYSKCGFPEMAGNVFFGMPHKNLVAWNSMISCYCRNGHPEQSITLLLQILQQGLHPDIISITSVLVAVSSISALLKGKILHGYLIRLEIPSDIQVENALLDMYIKCGFLNYAQRIFQNMAQKNLVTWNSMIAGYSFHGECITAMKMYNKMKDSGTGIVPDDITFLLLISACNHSGLVEEGQNLFQSMAEYGIEPRMEHYVNMVDLLGRAGKLDDAYSFVKNMPIEPNRSIWLALLCACRAHRNVELGELAAHNLVKLEPSRGSNYVQLTNIYGEAEMWDKAANLRALMRERGLKKSPGCSWIEVRNRVHVFFSGDSSNPRRTEIYKTLCNLRTNMEKKGDTDEGVEPF